MHNKHKTIKNHNVSLFNRKTVVEKRVNLIRFQFMVTDRFCISPRYKNKLDMQSVDTDWLIHLEIS